MKINFVRHNQSLYMTESQLESGKKQMLFKDLSKIFAYEHIMIKGRKLLKTKAAFLSCYDTKNKFKHNIWETFKYNLWHEVTAS